MILGLSNCGGRRYLKIPKLLRDVGINHNDIPKLADDAMKQQRLLVNNPRELNLDDAIAIYEDAL